MSELETLNSHLIFIKNDVEEELERKQAQLNALEAELAQQELSLITLRTRLSAFERHYMQTIGLLQAQLDELEVRYAELLVARHPHNEHWISFYQRAQTKAQESAKAANAWATGDNRIPFENLSVGQSRHFHPSADLKQIYREIAKQIHPDLAANEEERAFRNSLMIEANIAFQSGDESRLREVLLQWESHNQSSTGEEGKAKLANLNLRIQRVQARLQAIQQEMERLLDSALYKLYSHVEEAEARGVDLLAAMAEHLKQQINHYQTKIHSFSRFSV